MVKNDKGVRVVVGGLEGVEMEYGVNLRVGLAVVVRVSTIREKRECRVCDSHHPSCAMSRLVQTCIMRVGRETCLGKATDVVMGYGQSQ